MVTYQCIGCGQTTEGHGAGVCPVCGCRMLVPPFDRTTELKKEIRAHINSLRSKRATAIAPEFFRRLPAGGGQNGKPKLERTVGKAQDDAGRFPTFRKIAEYVCGTERREVFFDRLRQSIDKIGEHNHEVYRQTYEVSLDAWQRTVTAQDKLLKQALAVVDCNAEPEKLVVPKMTMQYGEVPDEALRPVADELTGLLVTLADRMEKYIIQNSIYGNDYRQLPRKGFRLRREETALAALERLTSQVKKVLAKKYVVDLLSDGMAELADMQTALWGAMEALVSLPILHAEYEYFAESGTIISNADLPGFLSAYEATRYAAVDAALNAPDFLAGKDEDVLFELYKRLLNQPCSTKGASYDDRMPAGESEQRLNRLIGLTGVKDSIHKIKAYALANHKSGKLSLHMCFLGNPGSGKTEVARIIAGILHENGILPTDKIVEVDRSGLVGQYVGETAQKTRQAIERAIGGVLFVDEAYALVPKDGGVDYGQEAIATLVKAMEDERGQLCVIFAGYRNEMHQMLDSNPGFRSRIQFILDFPNYSREELKEIAALMLRERHYTVSDAAMERILDVTDDKRKDAAFANARELRNVLDQVIMCQNVRCLGTDEREIAVSDVERYVRDAGLRLAGIGSGTEHRKMTGEEKLDALVGLDAVKRMVKKIKAYAKRNREDGSLNLHMCFYGNPGTGKTEVARIISEILYDAGVLKEAKLIETDAHGLIGKYVGQTAPKTEAKVRDAMNGVLFVDEAYALLGSDATDAASGYGEEAIATLLKAMEDYRGQFCVIMAGYRDEMEAMLESNPGLASRIQFTLDFPDYTREELGQIAVDILVSKRYEITDDALQRLLDIAEYERTKPNFANARTVRNVLDQVIMNQNLRAEDRPEDRQIILADVEDYLADEGIDLRATGAGTRRIGFV